MKADTTLHPPSPGVVWGRYPQRADAAAGTPARPGVDAAGLLPGVLAGVAAACLAPLQRRRQTRRVAAARAWQAEWRQLDAGAQAQPHAHAARLADLRARLARDGWSGALRAEALGCVAHAGQRWLGRNPFDTQLRAADALLDDQLAEMATGEGKTYAVALAAAVAALAGVPVHVLTANDYLVRRDAALLQPFYAALGLRVGSVLATSSPDQRRAAYACDLTYCTAREVAFDYLRDSLGTPAGGPELRQRSALLAGTHASEANAPLLRGLCLALLDEADSLLIDEATLPLVLAQAHADPQQRAACFQALALARQLEPGVDVDLDDPRRPIEWREPGLARLETLSAGLDGAWHNRRHRQDLVGSALEALHRLHRDRHYLVRDGQVHLLDAVTGRIASGRVWPRGLQTLVELKEGCSVSPASTTRSQISFQRFFARYLRLAGVSGTLVECRAELRALYRRDVATIALRLPSRRQRGPDRWFADQASRWQAALQRVAALHAAGRPVLIGTGSVAESETFSALLAGAGLPHRVLNARHDADEAAIVAQAGQRSALTVATHMAGRGTDIELGPGVAALGGLHVLCCQDNPSRRLDRQLIGRCARQGDPGSAEIFRTLAVAEPHPPGLSTLGRICRKPEDDGAVGAPRWLAHGLAAWWQHQHEMRARRQRSRLLDQDRRWESQWKL